MVNDATLEARQHKSKSSLCSHGRGSREPCDRLQSVILFWIF